MLAGRKARPHPIVMEIPPHNPSSSDAKAANKAPSKEVRDANAPVSPQPQQNTGHHHSHHPQQPPSYHSRIQQQQPQQQQQQQPQQNYRASPAHPRRGLESKDTLKSKPSISKAVLEHVGPYVLSRTLGKGSSGCVKLARHRKTNEQVAVKIISKASLANKAAVHRGIEREIAIMKLINHPHVIRLYDVYETEKELFLVMEYVSGGELFEYLVNKGRLDETEALRFFQQIIVGLAFCHKRKICHRDLKPENLLLDDRMNVKIADFGMASLQKTGRLLETSCGSPHYASPEVVTGLKYDGSSSDIWSCGIILYALLTGHLPFDDENIRQLLSKVKSGKFYMPTDISSEARDLISRMLTVNPKRRITMQGVMTHPWFRMVNPDHNTLGEPAEDPKGARPFLKEELDAEILLHIRWLFAPGPSHSDPEAKAVFDEEALLREIEEKMTNDEENLEKLFYQLLCQHKTELLENYSINGADSTVPDGPRRRADSFPSSTLSVRSHTPDFSRAPLSPHESLATTPESSPSPTTTEPSPLTLNPLEAAVARAASAAKIAARTSCISINIKDPDSGTRESKSQLGNGVQPAAVVKKDKQLSPLENHSLSQAKDEESLKIIKSNDYIQGKSRRCSEIIAPASVTPMVQHAFIANTVLESAPAPSAADLTSKLHTSVKVEENNMTSNAEASTASPTIESQVISTQISEAEVSSTISGATDCGTAAEARLDLDAASALAAATSKIPTTSSPKLTSAVTKPVTVTAKPARSILRPLDVKASAGATTMVVCVSPHSRQCPESSQSTSTPIPISPNGPKRPWFARLFDFKPQPLTFRSIWSVAETQERLETILKNLYQSNIQIESFKKPSYGIKCRYEGGVINGQQAKAVKFKIEITEKSGYFNPSAHNVSSNSSVSATNSHAAASSAVAAILATVDIHQSHLSHPRQYLKQHHGTHSQSHLFTRPSVKNNGKRPLSGSAVPDSAADRRASDGGSVLSGTAVVVTNSLAATAAKKSLNYRHMTMVSSNNGNTTEYPPRSHPPALSRNNVKATLHQQQGANSTLKIIYEQLQVVWDQQAQTFEQQSWTTSSTSTVSADGISNSSEVSLIRSSLLAISKIQRGAAI